MSHYDDRVNLTALQLIDAAARGDDSVGRALDAQWSLRRLPAGTVEQSDVMQALVTWMAVLIQKNPDWRAILDQQLNELRLIIAAEIPDVDEG